MSRSTKKEFRERLLDELQFREELSTLAPEKFSCSVGSTIPPKGTLLTHGALATYADEIKKTMLDVYDYDEEGFLHIKINLSLPRDLLHYLIDRAIDEYPKQMLNNYISHKSKKQGLKLKDFLKVHYPPVIIYQDTEGKLFFALPAEDIRKEASARLSEKVMAKRFRPERLRALEVYRSRCIGKVIQFPVYKGRERMAKEYRNTVKKKSFVEIGTELGIKKDAARKNYNTAYELIHGAPYRKGVKAKVQKTFLKKECGTCKDRPNCKKLCPDVLSYANQDWYAK